VIAVYRYGMPAWVELPEDVVDQLRLVHDLREDLVTLEHRLEDAISAIWSSYPDIRELETRLAAAVMQAEVLEAGVAEEKGKQRTRRPTTPLVAELTAARAAVRTLKQQRREQIRAVHGAAQPGIAAAVTEHRAAVKALYSDYVQTRGLYWACYNRTVERHRTAARRIAADRAAGRHGRMRHHRFDGSGVLSVQLQRQRHEPQRTPALLASGTGRWRTVLQLTPWIPPEVFEKMPSANRRRAARGTVTFHIGRNGSVELPVIVHRMLPADADVVTAQLVVRRVAGGRRVHLNVTVRLPDPVPSSSPDAVAGPDGAGSRPAVAVHFEWRRVADDGTLQVATWLASAPLLVSDGVRDVVMDDGSWSGTIQLPGSWRAATARDAELASRRDTRFDAIQATVVDWLRRNPPGAAGSAHPPICDGWEPPTAAEVARWHAPARLVIWARRIAERTSQPIPASLEVLFAQVEQWRREDRHLWERQTHGRDKALGRRDDAWRRVAAWLALTSGQIVLDDTVLTELSRTEATPIPQQVVAVASRQRMDAAVGRLREQIKTAAAREGVAVTLVSHLGLGRIHAACGYENPTDEVRRSADITCGGCGLRYDRDRNAVRLMLGAAATTPTSPKPTTVRRVTRAR